MMRTVPIIVLLLASVCVGYANEDAVPESSLDDPQSLRGNAEENPNQNQRDLAGDYYGYKTGLVGECEPYNKHRDCDKDEQCKGHLLCAERHKDELEWAGYNRNTAYCKGWYPDWFEVCYDPFKILKPKPPTYKPKPPTYKPRPPTYKPRPPTYKPRPPPTHKPPVHKPKYLRECEYDCNFDRDCAGHLLCAAKHQHKLKYAGLSTKRAYCKLKYIPHHADVCFNPHKVKDDKLGECEYDCDSDKDCKHGLVCAEGRKDELQRKGYGRGTAYCKGKFIPKWAEVCYDPKKIKNRNNKPPPPPTYNKYTPYDKKYGW